MSRAIMQSITPYSGHGAHLRQGRSTSQKNDKGEALARFVLLLSDQQALAGLAVLIQAIANSFGFTRYKLLLVVITVVGHRSFG
jgi:hypothetical protein